MGHHVDAVARSPPLTERVQNGPRAPVPRTSSDGPWSTAGAAGMVGMRTSNGSPW